MKRFLSAAAAALILTAACGENGPGGNANVQVSFATQRPVGASPSVMAALNDTLVSGSDTLVITRVELVLREIELRRLSASTCIEDDDACETFETGPVLVNLPLTPGAQQRFALSIPADTYTEIEFEVHKPSDDDAADSLFILNNPAFADISIRVQGTYNGTAFVFTSDLNVDQKLPLSPALVVVDGVATNVTIFVDVSTWFRPAGGALIDPVTANKGGTNENLVKANIENSFAVFEDANRDGSDD